MANERNHKDPENSEQPRWYQTSFIFVLLGFELFAVSMWLLGMIAVLLAVINARNDNWYKHS
jgi:hypothetical protein